MTSLLVKSIPFSFKNKEFLFRMKINSFSFSFSIEDFLIRLNFRQTALSLVVCSIVFPTAETSGCRLLSLPLCNPQRKAQRSFNLCEPSLDRSHNRYQSQSGRESGFLLSSAFVFNHSLRHLIQLPNVSVHLQEALHQLSLIQLTFGSFENTSQNLTTNSKQQQNG